ncbi:calcium-binding protein [Brucella sp. MAB-22]|uniref:EF-hand domain-containing protein n=1 Tax=Brucella TaxID=234 RepID=UPI000F65D9FB|nr:MULTISPECIES: calcium-binding protein [Brucella]RRY21665.1 calcium-binding protein [Brucella anthropi]UYT55745.1 calcium-binding protein [Brucella sp. MAB-22]
MKSKTAFIAVIATSLLAVPALAQENSSANTDKPAAETTVAPNKDMKGKRGPVDLEKFSRMDDLKAADTDGDGVLSRAEIEALALKRIVSRAADRMERRLDVNGDGKVTLAEVENQRKKEFAALDRNEDGKIDRSEMRAAKMHHQARGSHHKGSHHMGNHKGGEHKGPMKDQAEKPQE